MAPPGNSSEPRVSSAFFNKPGIPPAAFASGPSQGQLPVYSNEIRLSDGLAFIEVGFGHLGAEVASGEISKTNADKSFASIVASA